MSNGQSRFLTPEEQVERNATIARVNLAVAEYLKGGGDPKHIFKAIRPQFPEEPKTSLYRWVQNAMKNGTAGRALLDKQRAEAAAGVVGAEAVVGMVVPGSGGVTAFPVQADLRLALDSIRGVLLFARGEDAAKPRNPKMTLSASQALTQTYKDFLEINEAMTQAKRLDEFHAALIQIVAEESPEVASRIMAKLTSLTAQIGA